jgi:exopolysaccharide biosynthesis polyprenyl glycosylphosphotransferase
MNLFGTFIPKRVAFLLVTENLILGAAFLTVSALVELEPSLFLTADNGWVRIGIVITVVHAALYYADLYKRVWVQSRLWLLQQLSLALGVAFFAQAILSYLRLEFLILPKWTMIGGSALAFVGVAAWRMMYSRVILVRLTGERVLMVGATPVTREIATHFQQHPEVGFTVMGVVDNDPRFQEQFDAAFPRFDELSDAVAHRPPELIIVGVPESTHLHVYAELLDLKYRQIRIERAELVYERIFGRVLIQSVTVAEMLFGVPVRSKSALTAVQTLYSCCLAALAGLLLMPALLAVAIAVRATSPGPALFRQRRVGLNSREFTLFKFRSMYEKSDAQRPPVEGDPRITPLGHWLRRLRIDELPQLWNVLKGDMLLVGPRPEIPPLVKVYVQKIPLYQQRLLVKPGITGWAQISYKAEDSLEDTVKKLGFDLYYIRNMSLSFDSWILFHTLKTMLLGRGAR